MKPRVTNTELATSKQEPTPSATTPVMSSHDASSPHSSSPATSSLPHELAVNELSPRQLANNELAGSKLISCDFTTGKLATNEPPCHSASCLSTFSHLGMVSLTPPLRTNSRRASSSLQYKVSPSSTKGQIPMTYCALAQPKGIPLWTLEA